MKIEVEVPYEKLYPKAETNIDAIKAIRSITGCCLIAAKRGYDMLRYVERSDDVNPEELKSLRETLGIPIEPKLTCPYRVIKGHELRERMLVRPMKYGSWEKTLQEPSWDHLVTSVHADIVTLARPYAVFQEYSKQPLLTAEVYDVYMYNSDREYIVMSDGKDY